MTAIAYKNGVLAGDTMCIYEGEIKYDEPKVTKRDGYLYGAAGADCPSPDELGAWLWSNPGGKLAEYPNRDFTVLFVTPDKRISLVRHTGETEQVPGDFYAIGSGSAFCMGAMAAGASAVQAVKLATQYVSTVGGYVTQVLHA